MAIGKTPLTAVIVAAVSVLQLSIPAAGKAADADIVVGTGVSAGVHYNVGRAICRQIRRSVKGVSCEVLRMEAGDATEPLAILSDLRNAALELGLVASDWHHHAVAGSGPLKFLDVKFDNLRSVMALHGEPLTLIARKDSGINGLDDLAGKRVNIGTPGSPERVTMNMVMKAKGWTKKSFQYVEELSPLEQSLALCHNRVQAIISTTAHPNPALARTLRLCDAKIVEVSGAAVDKLIGDNKFLSAAEVPGGLYEGVDAPVKTFGLTVTLISSSDMEDDVIYTVTKAVFDDLDRFKRSHGALGDLTPGRMKADGLSAPLHPGALRYFREKGMM